MDRVSPSDLPIGADGLSLALSRELKTGERVLWQGRPMARVSMLSFGMYLFAVPWTAFSVFWTAMAFAGVSGMATNDWGWLSLAFPLFGVPFVAIGIGMLAMPFLPLYYAKKTLFAVTDKRLIKLTLGKALVSETVPVNRVGPITRRERPDGSGSLKIGVRVGTDSDGDRTVETFDIGDVRDIMEVERRIDEMVSRYAARRVSP